MELVWNGKTSEVFNILLPSQVSEEVDEPRAENDARLQMNMFDLYSRDASSLRRIVSECWQEVLRISWPISSEYPSCDSKAVLIPFAYDGVILPGSFLTSRLGRSLIFSSWGEAFDE